jgi:transposase
MLSTSSQLKVFVAREPVDLRRGHDGLCKLAEGALGSDPYSGHYFVFFGKRLDRIKVLFWDKGGFVIYYKRLARGRFRMPALGTDGASVELDGAELAMLLGGFDVRSARRTPVWRPGLLRAG